MPGAPRPPLSSGFRAWPDAALFGKVLQEKMDELKIPCELYAGGKRVGGGPPRPPLAFLKEHLIGDR